MAVREFNGSNQWLTFLPGAFDGKDAGPFTAIVTLKRLTDTTDDPIFQIAANTSGSSFTHGITWRMLANDTMDFINPSGSASASTGLTVTVADGWVALVVRKATGTIAPTFLKYPFSTGVLSAPTTGSAAIADGSAVASTWRLQVARDNFFNLSNVRFGTLAFYNSVLDPTAIETALDARTTQALYELGPFGLLDFNQDSSVDPVLDLTGGGLNEATQTVSTVVTTDDPPSWVFGVAPTDDIYVRVAGAWVASNKQARVSGAWF